MLNLNDERLKHCVPNVYRTPFVERVWANGQIYREAYAVSTTEGAAIANRYLAERPTESHITDDPLNWVGYSAGGVREPYDNETYSIYIWNQIPSNANVSIKDDNRTTPLPWYGIKYDSATGAQMLKVPYFVNYPHVDKHTPRPTVIPPNNYEFYGRLFYQDGTPEKHIDCYIACDAQSIRNMCDKIGIQFPVPDDHLELVNLWGIVYDSDTLEITMVKAYEIVPYTR